MKFLPAHFHVNLRILFFLDFLLDFFLDFLKKWSVQMIIGHTVTCITNT